MMSLVDLKLMQAVRPKEVPFPAHDSSFPQEGAADSKVISLAKSALAMVPAQARNGRGIPSASHVGEPARPQVQQLKDRAWEAHLLECLQFL